MLRRARTLGERINDTSLVQVLPELLLLRIWCLQARMQKTAVRHARVLAAIMGRGER